jgi:phasin family protein
MLSFSKSFTPAAKSHMEAQLSMFTDLSKSIFNSAQKINELNIQVAQTVMEETVNNAHELIAAEDPADFLSIAASQAQPTAEKVRAYQQHLTDIAAGAQVDMAKTAENHVPETTRTAAALANEVAQRAAEETDKVTQRQKAAIDKLSNPINMSQDENRSAAARSGEDSRTAAARAAQQQEASRKGAH